MAEGGARPDRPLGRGVGRRRRRAPRGRQRAGRGARPRLGGGLPGRVLRGGAARGPGAQRALRARRGGARRPPGAPRGRHAPRAVREGRRVHRPRGPRVHRAGLGARGRAPAPRLPPVPVLQDAGRDGGAVRGPARGARELGRDRAPLRLRVLAGQDAAAGLPHAGGRGGGRLPAHARDGGPGGAPGRVVSGPRAARGRAAALRRAPGLRGGHHRADGLPGLLPDRRGLHQLGQAQRRPRRARAAARARARSWRGRWASPASTRCATSSSSSASSTRSACRCPTSTSTSARRAATA